MKYIIFALLLLPIVNAVDLNVNVPSILSAEEVYFDYNNSVPAGELYLELLNNGSIGYTARAAVYVTDQNGNIVFTGWSAARRMFAGGRGVFRIFWVPSESGNFSARMVLYYGQNRLELAKNITAYAKEGSDIFDISDVKVFAKHIEFTISSKEEAKNIIVTADDYPQGWIFSQATISDVSSFPRQKILTYEPSLWYPTTITLVAASRDGRYLSKKTLPLQRESGAYALIKNVIFFLTHNAL